MKNVQIPYELFVDLVLYHLSGEDDFDEDIRQGLEQKLDAMLNRQLYSQYKTAPTDKQREQARQEYYNISPKGRIDRKLEKEFIEKQIKGLDIKTSDPELPASSLSGGNQQKLVVGNWLNCQPKILLMDEPSRGIDVNAKQQIFNVMWREAQKGISIIMVSSELEELLEVCDRILIMRGGRIREERPVSALTVESIYSLCMQEDE